MNPDEIKIPVPMRDAWRIYAALGYALESLRRMAANEANDEFVETLDELMARLKDSHNAVIAARGANRDELIEGLGEDRSAPPSQRPRHDSNMPQDRAELLNRLYSAQTEEQVDDATDAAERWLAERLQDEDVRLARAQAMRRRAGAPPH
jgi:hypothetical protein